LRRFTQQRATAAKAGLIEAIVQKAQMSPGGLSNQTQSLGIIGITEDIYVRLTSYILHAIFYILIFIRGQRIYLSLVAKENYFVASTGSMEVGIKTFQPRLFIV
jgi:hypothetical protein